MPVDENQKQIVTLKTIIAAIILAMIGILLLFISEHDNWFSDYKALQSVIRDIGSLSLVTLAITILWDLWGKRSFTDEILAKAKLSKEVADSGIVGVTDTFHDQNIDWRRLFTGSTKLDIYFAYGSTWRNTHADELNRFVQRPDARIRVVLPDYTHQQTTTELAGRFGYSPEDLTRRITEAIDFFNTLGRLAHANGSTVEIWALPAAPLFSFYRFDNKAILALYSHRKERTSVPTLVLKNGKLYDFIRKEFDSMVLEKGLARKL